MLSSGIAIEPLIVEVGFASTRRTSTTMTTPLRVNLAATTTTCIASGFVVVRTLSARGYVVFKEANGEAMCRSKLAAAPLAVAVKGRVRAVHPSVAEGDDELLLMYVSMTCWGVVVVSRGDT